MLICDTASTRNDQFCTEEPSQDLKPHIYLVISTKFSPPNAFLLNPVSVISVTIQQVAWVRDHEGHSCHLRLSALPTQTVFRSHWSDCWNPFSHFWCPHLWFIEVHIISHFNASSLLSGFPALTTSSFFTLLHQWPFRKPNLIVSL